MTRAFPRYDDGVKLKPKWIVSFNNLLGGPTFGSHLLILRMLDPLVRFPCPNFSTHAESSSVVDGLFVLNEVLHRLDFLRGVSLPIQVFANDPQRLT